MVCENQQQILKPEKHIFEAQQQLKYSLLFFPTTALYLSCAKINFHETMTGINLKKKKTNTKPNESKVTFKLNLIWHVATPTFADITN